LLTLSIRAIGKPRKFRILPTKDLGFTLKLIILIIMKMIRFTDSVTLAVLALISGKSKVAPFTQTFW